MTKPVCPFCGIDRNPATETTLHGNNVVSFEPLNPVVPGHRLFISRIHTKNAAEKPAIAGYVFAGAAQYALYKGEPFNLITSGGVEATQSVFHFHVHYVPRAEGDGLHLPWTGQRV